MGTQISVEIYKENGNTMVYIAEENSSGVSIMLKTNKNKSKIEQITQAFADYCNNYLRI